MMNLFIQLAPRPQSGSVVGAMILTCLWLAQLAFFNQYLAFGDAELFGEKFHR